MDTYFNAFYNTKRKNADGVSCYGLSAHRSALFVPDVADYIRCAELNPNVHQYSCTYKEFVKSSDTKITDVLTVLQSKNDRLQALEDGGTEIFFFLNRRDTRLL